MSNSPQDHSHANRREFLKGNSAIDAMQAKIDMPRPLSATPRHESGKSELTPNVPAHIHRQATYLEQYSKNAMACEFEIFFNLHQYHQSGQAVANGFQLIDDLEDQLTVYRDHSEVSCLNRTALNNWVQVEPQLFGLLNLADEIYGQTSGAFDITAAALTKLWRFDRRSGAIPTPSEIDAVLKCVGGNFLEFDLKNSQIRFNRPGVEINLGGIGKGHALDRVAQMFLHKGIDDFMIHGGQSSVLACGESTEIAEDIATGPLQPGWKVGLTHPTLPAVRLAEITLRNQALGTSGTGRQGFFHQGKRYGHIIDPRNGWPASHFLSTTVITSSAALSDALATAFFVMSIKEIESYCQQNPHVSAILITNLDRQPGNASDKRIVGSIQIQSINMDESAMQFFE